MKWRSFRDNVITALLIVAGLVIPAGAYAQVGNAERSAASSSTATPRAPDGKPDLSGYWRGASDDVEDFVQRGDKPDEKGNINLAYIARPCHPGQAVCHAGVNQSNDSTFTARMDANRPPYKPQYWDKVRYLDQNTNKEDPAYICQPYGIPRMGPPTRILQTAKDVVLLYQQGGAAASPQDFRIIPTDGRKLEPAAYEDVTYYGRAVGRWEGDTLVVEAVGFNDLTWLARGGYFHSDQMTVTERFRREGNTLHYQATVTDPVVFLEPWVMNPQALQLNNNPNATILEGLPCDERDQEHMVGTVHH